MENLRVIMILEILGKPKEHIMKVLNEIIDKLEKESSVKMINKSVAEPKKLEQKDLKEDIFTSFAEVEIETNLNKLIAITFAYTPAHIDIITPENINIKNSDLNFSLNELLMRLHQYDELAKALMIERQMIAKHIQEGKIKVEKIINIKENKKKEKKRR